MPICHRTAHHHHSVRIALIVGALFSLTAPTALQGLFASAPARGQNKTDSAAAALEQPSYTKRIKTLEARRERQLRLGLADDAARTGQEIEALQRERQQKCEGLWKFLERSQQPGGMSGKDAKEILRYANELSKDTQIYAACGTRPGTSLLPGNIDMNALDDRLQTMLKNQLETQLESQDQAGRGTLFVEPVLSTEADVPSAQKSVTYQLAGTTRQDASPLDSPIMALMTEVGRAAGDFDRMKAILEAALVKFQDPVSRGWVLENLRIADQRRGDIRSALVHTQSQLDLFQRTDGADSPRLCFPLWQSIPLLLDSQQPDRALAAAQRCLTLAAPKGARSLTHASALNNLALVYQRTGSLALAVSAYEKAWAIVEQIPITPTMTSMETTQPPHVNIRANLGLAYWQQGDAVRASQHIGAARAQMNKEGGRFITERGTVESLAKLEAEVDALLTLERAVARQALASPPVLALPLIFERKGLALEEKAATIRKLGTGSGELREYQSLLAYRARLARGTPIQAGDPSATGERMSEAEFQIASLEWDTRLRVQTASLDPARSAKDTAEYVKYQTAVSKETQKLISDYYKRAPKGELRSEIVVQSQFDTAARAKVDPKFPRVVAAQQTITRGAREDLLARIQAQLSESSVLLEMLHFRPMNVSTPTAAERWQPARYGAYLVKHAGPPLFIDFGESAAIDELIVEFRRTLARPRGTLAHDLGRRLDGILMQAVRQALGRATTVYLSPDGALNLVPFAALVDEQDRYLIETLTFDYVSSGRDLVRPALTAIAPQTSSVIVADPAFDGSVDQTVAAANAPVTRGLADHRFDRLPGTAAEARSIASLLGRTTVLTGANATETAIKSVAAPRVLHIATHGFFLADQDLSTATSPGGGRSLEDPMLRSGLVFAGANIGRSGVDDGVLTALEAAGLNLFGTQLVVLSACETGVGEVKTGEGVFGLRRAFMVAGAETLVMSLWQVDDDATQQLMAEFYRRLTSGQGRAEALRQAALTLQRDSTRRHPFFWASFIASGNAGPLHR